MSGLTGLHHVTAIAGDAQENLDFYVGVMGMRLVKRSVNQDAVGTYHLFFADAVGSPGTDLTFFPWPDLPEGRQGAGLNVEVALAVPTGSLDFWEPRLSVSAATVDDRELRFGELSLPFRDPHGLRVVLIETDDERVFVPWTGGPVAPSHQVRGLHGVRVLTRDATLTGQTLQGPMGMRRLTEEAGWTRFTTGDGGSGTWVDVSEERSGPRGLWGRGSIHHVAFRVPDDASEALVRQDLATFGRHPTAVIDRFWFRSVYFKEPGGALFEIATDGPGFTVDESVDSLGEHLVLPPWLEPRREEIESGLPELRGGRTG